MAGNMGGEYGGDYYGGVPRVGGRDTLKSFSLSYKNNAPFCMDGMDMFKCAFGGQSDGVHFILLFCLGGGSGWVESETARDHL